MFALVYARGKSMQGRENAKISCVYGTSLKLAAE
jgi:hypothetical protein